MFRIHRIVLCALALCGVFLGGCNHAAPTGGGNTSQQSAAPGAAVQGTAGPWTAYENAVNYAEQHGTVSFRATYKPNAVVFDEQATEKAMRGVSPDGIYYVLDAGSPLAAKLKPGSVLFLYGMAVRKVVSVQRQGSTVTLGTADADLTDLIQDGRITFKVRVDYSIQATQAPQAATLLSATPTFEDLFATRADADESENVEEDEPTEHSFEGTAGPVDYDLDWNLDSAATPPRLNFDLKYQYSRFGGLWRTEAVGWVEHDDVSGDLQISNGAWEKIELFFDGFSGHVVFDWMAQQNSKAPIPLLDQTIKVRIPYANYEFPLILRGIPLVLEASAALLIHPAWTGPKDITRGKYTVDWLGNVGFVYTAGAPEPEGEISDETESIDPTESGSFGPNAFGFVAALEAPRFEVALASMWPPSWVKLGANYKVEGQIMRGITENGKYSSLRVRNRRLLEMIELIAQPIKPYGYIDAVTATGSFTNGMITSSLVYTPPCQRSQLTVTMNAGAGIKLNFLHHMPISVVKKILATVGHSATVEVFEASKPIYGPKTIYEWNQGIKCPGDSSSD